MRSRGATLVPVAVATAVLAMVAAAVVVFVLGGDDAPGPEDAAADFAAAWEEGDGERLRALVTDQAALDATDPVAVVEDLGATATAIHVGEVDELNGGQATATFTATLTLGDVGEAAWQGSFPLVDDEDRGWVVDWDPASLHRALQDGGTLRRSTTWPDRAPILGVGDQQLVGPVDTVVIGIEPRRLQDRAAAATALFEQLGVDPADVDAALDAPGVEPDHFVRIVEVPRPAYEAVRDVIFPVPGLLFREATGRGGPAAGFARHTVGRFGEITAERLEQLGPPYAVGDLVGLDGLEARFEQQLAGLPAVDIDAVDAAGEVVAPVASFPATEPTPVRTTLDPRLQEAADAALRDVAVPAALVAVDAATGEVRAISSSPLADAFNRAIGGAYPPGSTFKVITAYALLANGVGPDTTVDCPPELVVDGRAFQNFEGGALGPVPFARAFADSCNTAMIGAAGDLPDGALAAAAEAFGFGVDYSLGPTTLGGSFPETAGAVEAAAAAIGQAQVTAGPIHMATVAAAVLDGTWRSPILLPGDPGTAEQVVRPLDPAIVEPLRGLMRSVVADGSGTAAQIPGLDVLGKTGTAEFGQGDPPPTHAWFIAAARGLDGNALGIAVVLEGGGVGGRDAAPVAARFLSAVADGADG